MTKTRHGKTALDTAALFSFTGAGPLHGIRVRCV